LVPIWHNVAWTKVHPRASAVSIHPAIWPQWTSAENWGGGSAPFLRRRAGSPSNTKSPGPRPTSIPSSTLIHPAIWPQQIWAENWGLYPFGVRVANTMWSVPRPTCMPSFILIHPTVWPQKTNVTDRTGQTGQRPIAEGEQFYKRSPKNHAMYLQASG